MSDTGQAQELYRKIAELEAEVARLRAEVQSIAESVLEEFKEELTGQQRRYIVDQIVRRAAEV